MKETILHTPRTLSFAKRIVKRLPPAMQRRLPAEAAVAEISPRQSCAINLRYRGKNKAANVLSFFYDDISMSFSGLTRESRTKILDSRVRGNDKRGRRKNRTYGEILVCPAVIRREAKAQKHSFAYQMTWMILHGMIHLSGLHHEESASAEKKFSRIEQKILQHFRNGSPRHHHRT